MVANLQDIENIAIPLPIPAKTRTIAHEFAIQQATKQKSEQVFYNTLAVLTVKSYLEMLGITTDLANSDSWDPVMRACDNVADLNIANSGRLECRPLKNIDLSCHIPMEVWDLRLGYIVVQIDESLKKASLLGFVPKVTSEELSISILRPIEALIDRLHDVKISIFNSSVVNLGQWFDNIFVTGWSTVESFLNPEQLTTSWGFRNAEFPPQKSPELGQIKNSIQRAKLIDLGIQLGDRQVILLVEIALEDNGNIGVSLQVHPSQSNVYVPETLILKVIESSGQVFMQAQARSQDNYIQLQFSGQPGEQFSVQIVLNGVELTEQFQL